MICVFKYRWNLITWVPYAVTDLRFAMQFELIIMGNKVLEMSAIVNHRL